MVVNNWTSYANNMNLDPYPVLYTKINSKWIIDLSLKSKTFIKLIEENTGESFGDLGISRDFFRYQKHNPLKKKLINWI